MNISRYDSLQTSRKGPFADRWVVLWLLIPLLLLVPGMLDFAYPASDPRFSDMSLAHYPYAVLQKDAIIHEQRLRLWSPLILSGAPLSANPLAGLWYPPGWLAWVLPVPLAFNLLVMLHLLCGGLGMQRLLLQEGLRPEAALLGALAFGMMPKLFAHYGAGHVTLVFAVLWTPWLLIAARRRTEFPDQRHLFLREAFILAAICLADIRWVPFAGSAWLLYCIFLNSRPGQPHRKSIILQVMELLKPVFLAVLLAGILWVPLLEFTLLSTRAQLAVQENLTYSLPFQRLLGLLFPDLGGFHEWVVYSGVVIFMLSLITILALRREHRSNFWIALLLGSLLFATLTQLELFQFLTRLPGMSLMRVPARSLFLFGMSLAALSASAVDRLLDNNDRLSLQNSKRIILGLCGFTVVFLAGLRLVRGSLPLEFLWGGVLLLVGSLWVWLKMNQKVSGFLWFSVLLGLCLLDWGVIDRSLFTVRKRADVLAEGAAAAGELAGVPGEYRIYSPSYSLPQQTAVSDRLELADGVDPLQLQDYVEFMERASGVPWNGYSVTLPPFNSGEPQSDNAAFSPDAGLLGLLNVHYVASEFDLQSEGLVLREKIGETRLYVNREGLPRLWIQPLEAEIGQNIRPVNVIRWSPEKIEAETAGPGLLVLSEIMYPGWRVQVDGSPATIIEAAGLLRSVILPADSHHVLFYFLPVSLYVGAALCLAGFVLAGLFYRRFCRDAGKE